MRQGKRISANLVKKFLPTLRRINTAEGRRWTVDGKQTYVTLNEVIEAYTKEKKNEVTKQVEVGIDSAEEEKMEQEDYDFTDPEQNPFILTGEELARTEAARKRGE